MSIEKKRHVYAVLKTVEASKEVKAAVRFQCRILDDFCIRYTDEEIRQMAACASVSRVELFAHDIKMR